jgi:hypothetical protein
MNKSCRNNAFLEIGQFLCRKVFTIAENCVRIIDPGDFIFRTHWNNRFASFNIKMFLKLIISKNHTLIVLHILRVYF